ncbi:DUF4349 domain-containing protein [Streptomyces sp. NPDC056112]|uniref:DUF4349 domain-containing protein n=2 Tax=Streptomyces TaxID=1883 RepID=UPI001CD214B1|nr:DUF4349 domain-containing protein [Streptomyces sp. CoT10]
MRTRRSVRPASALAGLLLAAALALTGCGAGDSGGDSSAAAKSGAEAADGGARKGAPDTGGGQASEARATTPPRVAASHIIRTASLTVQVKDVPKALDAARTTVENAGGYVGDESTSRDEEGHERTRVVLRVPADRYDEVLGGLEGTGKLIERTAKAQDVTDQVVDVDSRIKSQRASVARVRELMDRATRLSDVVSLEGELSRRESDLESLLAQQASLKDRTSLATITLSLSRTPAPEPPVAKDDQPGFMDALAGGWHVFVTVLRWIALAIGALLPFAAAAALLAALWLRVVRPRLPRRPVEATPTMTALGAVPDSRRAPAPPAQKPGGEPDPQD